jgi:hypothetical protein
MAFDNYSTEAMLHSGLEELCMRPSWANARDCQSLVKALYESRAQRGSMLRVYEAADVNYALASLGAFRTMSTSSGIIKSSDDSLMEDSVNPGFDGPLCAAGASSSLKQSQSQNQVQKERKHQRQSAKEIDAPTVKKAKFEEDKTKRDGQDPIFIALLQACREAGYDDNLIRRKVLVKILEAVLQGNVLSEDILSIVMKKLENRLLTSEVMEIVRPQVPIVLDGMKHAILVEELFVNKMNHLQNALIKATTQEERDRITKEIKEAEQKAREEANIRQKLKQAGTCPMGYTWHPCGSGWRCAGGSHFISSAELMHL